MKKSEVKIQKKDQKSFETRMVSYTKLLSKK